MPSDFFLQFTRPMLFRTLDGVPNAIWTYNLCWSESQSLFSLIGIRATGSPGARIGLEFSRRLNIRDPGNFTDVPEIQATKLERPTQGDVQYVYREFQSPPASPVVLSFIAPAEKDTFCPVKLVHKVKTDSPWGDLAFKTATEGNVATQQVMSGPAIVGPPTTAEPPSTGLTLGDSARHIEKATLVPLKVEDPIGGATRDGGVVVKFGYVRQLALQPGEVRAVQDRISESSDSTSGLLGLLKSFEGSPMPSELPPPSTFAPISVRALRTFGAALKEIRKQAVAQGSPGPHTASPAAARLPIQGRPTAVVTASPVELGTRLYLLHVATIANKAFEFHSGQTPIGMLNLERIEMAPAGIQRGELIATIPLAPLEETAVIQKEWSVTTKEFTSIVTDSLETLSETGVTDNTELAQSTTSQLQHGNQFNITGTVSGGIPLISGSVTASFGAQDSASQSATDSRKHAVSLTQKASSRAKREHKVTISTTTQTGTSETSTRLLKNPSTTDPIRIDYFSMMRKWRVRLYRYGLRLTYDIVIPEPAGALRKAYADLAFLQSQIGPFKFNVAFSEITTDIRVDLHETEPHYLVLAERFKAQVPLAPRPAPPLMPNATFSVQQGVHDFQLSFNIPPGYSIKSVTLDAKVTGFAKREFGFAILGTTFDFPGGQVDQTFNSTLLIRKNGQGNFLEHAEGANTVTFFFFDASSAMVQLTIETEPTEAAKQQWQVDVWNALFNAAQTQYFAQQQDLAAQISAIEDQLNNVDTLTLRREESDEIMKGALRFILGYGFEFMPDDVITAIKNSGADIDHGVGFTGNSLGPSSTVRLGLDPGQLAVVRNDEDRVRFINQAIEWENVSSFLYSYFWDIPQSWDFIRRIKHPDATRQAFLRAGSARVVLTIRKRWEDLWVRFTETGEPDGNTTSPYLTIAQELAAYDDRNYPGIPPANPGQSAVRLEDAVFTTSDTFVGGKTTNPVELKVASSAGFVVGDKVVIDNGVDANPSNVSGKQEAKTIVSIRDGTHITVESIDNSHGGESSVYPIVRPAEKGVLIAEWNEYTPTSGTDIAVTSNLPSIA